MNCKFNHDEDGMIPRFLCRVCNPHKPAAAKAKPQLVAQWVDPVEARQRELQAMQQATAQRKSKAALAKHLQRIDDEHAGEEYDRKAKMWKRTKRSMAKYHAKLRAEFEAEAAKQEEAA